MNPAAKSRVTSTLIASFFVASETSKLLLDRFGLAVDIQGVLDQVPRYTGHVSGFPCEHTHIASQEPDKRVFLFRIQVGPDKGCFAGITVDQLDRFMLLGLDVLA